MKEGMSNVKVTVRVNINESWTIGNNNHDVVHTVKMHDNDTTKPERINGV